LAATTLYGQASSGGWTAWFGGESDRKRHL
jgi:hypothetical protein